MITSLDLLRLQFNYINCPVLLPRIAMLKTTAIVMTPNKLLSLHHRWTQGVDLIHSTTLQIVVG